jgi:aminopeptidase
MLRVRKTSLLPRSLLIHQHCSYSKQHDVIIGVYDKGNGVSTPKSNSILENENESDLIKNAKWDMGKVRLAYLNKNKYKRAALVGVGQSQEKEPEKEVDEEKKDPYKQNNKIKLNQQFAPNDHGEWSITQAEKVREGVKKAVVALREDDRKNTSAILVDTSLAGQQYEQEAVEGAVLGTYEFKLPDSNMYDKTDPPLKIFPLDEQFEAPAFKKGKIYAQSQIMAATLAEMPANLMTPIIFSHTMKQHFESLRNDRVKVDIFDSEWAANKEMNSFLTVAKGSDEDPRVLEVTYTGNPDSSDIDLVLVGKGITFDSGGISLKPGAGMKDMKGDMGGAAATMSALHGIVQLGLPINVKGLAFLCENMPSSRAVKPGDVVRAMNKKSIEIDNTDAEGRLILADALCYASEMKPRVIVDCATLTGAIVVALGNTASGVFSSSNELWNVIDQAGQNTNDYMWRMPLFQDHYMRQIKAKVAKLVNVGGKEAGSCTAATFLSQFVDFDKVGHWSHIDIAGTSMTKQGMTGRPTRALIEMATMLSEKKI